MSPGQTDAFWDQYTSPDAIRKYSKNTAGSGITYLLDHDYKSVYLDALRLLRPNSLRRGIRMLEFGCGAGMNLIHLAASLPAEGIRVESGVGADFSPVLIEAAEREAAAQLGNHARATVRFCVGRNESLIADLASGLGRTRHDLEASFDFIFGVNTIRYCHRAGNELDCARDIFDLLLPGGVCVVIDMNDRFPLFRSALKDRLRGRRNDDHESYLPTLDEYAAPFVDGGFELVQKKHFCWIPHSAGPAATRIFGKFSPVLSMLAGSRAMRSLVSPESRRSVDGRYVAAGGRRRS